jgi:xanthine dehydrogenase accessory factor
MNSPETINCKNERENGRNGDRIQEERVQGDSMNSTGCGVRGAKSKNKGIKNTGTERDCGPAGLKIVIKGAGEMATGIAHRLYMAGMRNILMTEIPEPLSVRRNVSFCEAVYEGSVEVEGVKAECIQKIEEVKQVRERQSIAVLVDPQWKCIQILKPHVVVDATMAKRNLGTQKDEAPLVIGVGPGFTAPDGVHIVVESNRGHNLGRTIYNGAAEPYTGIPGQMMGYTKERVLRSPIAGKIKHAKKIGDTVKKGEIILSIDGVPLVATFNGILRGLIREIYVTKDEKIGDIDPRGKREHCYTISEKARAIAGGVLEAIMHVYNQPLPGI